MAVVVEVLGNNRRVLHRYILSHPSISIGRGYDNDVVLEDIHVDAEHATLHLQDEGGFLLVDNQSVNGLRDRRKRSVTNELTLNSGDEFYLGETLVRIVDTTQPLPEAISLAEDTLLRRVINNTSLGFTLLFLLVIMSIHQADIASIQPLKVDKAFQSSISIASILLLTAFALSFITRVIRRKWEFGFNLFLCASVAMVSEVTDFLLVIVAFNVNIVAIQWLVDALALALVVFLFSWGVCAKVFNLIQLHKRLVISGIVILVLGNSAVEHMFDPKEKYSPIPKYTQLFRPASYRLVSAMDDMQFIDSTQAIFDIEIKEDDDDKDKSEENNQVVELDQDQE